MTSTTPTGVASVRERYKEFCVEIAHELVVPEPIFGIGRWPQRPILSFNDTHYRCSLRMAGRSNAQLCVLATAVAENTDDTITFASVEQSEVDFYVRCLPDEKPDVCVEQKVHTVSANGMWTVSTEQAMARKVAVYHHNRCDVVEAFDNENTVEFGDMHMTLMWTEGDGHTRLAPEGPTFDGDDPNDDDDDDEED